VQTRSPAPGNGGKSSLRDGCCWCWCHLVLQLLCCSWTPGEDVDTRYYDVAQTLHPACSPELAPPAAQLQGDCLLLISVHFCSAAFQSGTGAGSATHTTNPLETLLIVADKTICCQTTRNQASTTAKVGSQPNVTANLVSYATRLMRHKLYFAFLQCQAVEHARLKLAEPPPDLSSKDCSTYYGLRMGPHHTLVIQTTQHQQLHAYTVSEVDIPCRRSRPCALPGLSWLSHNVSPLQTCPSAVLCCQHASGMSMHRSSPGQR
jgi:hypothetical protein